MEKILATVLTLAILGCGVVEFMTPQTTQNTEYYVSPNGSDDNNGTLDSPWKTLEYALGKLSPGDVLYLRGGIYYEHEISTSLKGTASAPITNISVMEFPPRRFAP